MWLYSIQRFIMHVWDKKEREREKKCQTVQRRKGGKKLRKAEVGEQMAEWQDNKLLILCVRLVKEMETVKSQRGAKNTAQYGTAHQIPFELMKTLWLMPLLHSTVKHLNFKFKVSMEELCI